MAIKHSIMWLIGNVMAKMVIQSVSESLNRGRESGFAEIREDKELPDIPVYQWSAILDGKQCNRCEWLDGKYFEEMDPSFHKIWPPLHQGGRCIVVGVMKEELINFPVTITKLTVGETAWLSELKKW